MKSVSEINVANKMVFLRVDFNVPLNTDLTVADNRRIVAALPTIRHIVEAGGKLVIASHLGRPKGRIVNDFSLRNVAVALSQLVDRRVSFAGDCIGEEVERKKLDLKSGEILVLENLRFHAGEEANDEIFAQQLAKHIDIYVNDAFGTMHRKHASIFALPSLVKERAYGQLIQDELKHLSPLLHDAKRPFLAIIGGAKVSDKIELLRVLLNKAQGIIVGGAMAYTFLKCQGISTGSSLVEDDKLDLAAELLKAAHASGVEILLPIDHVVQSGDSETPTTSDGASIAADAKALDIGPKTIERFNSAIGKAATIFWNGPMGLFENPKFAKGTFAVAEAIANATAKSGACSVIGGGDSALAAEQAGVEKRVSHISTGGGASLKFLEGKILPGLAALE